jgi:hypothetical protein
MTEDPQVAVKSVEERDREWLANVYRGDKEPDLTVRAILAGMAFGGLMSLSNLYVGLKAGWGLGVDIAAVVVIFAVFKALQGIGLVRREFGLMENTMMMTVAVAASWISSAGLVSAVPALQMLNEDYKFIPWQLTIFIAVILYLGLFMAILSVFPPTSPPAKRCWSCIRKAATRSRRPWHSASQGPWEQSSLDCEMA